MMSNFIGTSFRRSPRRKTASRALLIAAAAVLTLALAATAYANVREIGETANFTTPACQDKNCQVLTRTTAYQQNVGPKKNTSRIPTGGKVVAYTLYLPEVVKKFYSYYADTYGGAPTARISVLRPAVRRGVPYRYSLVSQSDRINLRNYLGGTPTFALSTPLAVRRGDILAMTTDTWIPSFTVINQDAASVWRSSRPKGKCTDLSTPRMHEKVGQIKAYPCGYKGARVLYHATVVDTPKVTNTSK